MRRGFISGIVLAVLVATGVMSAVQFTSANGSGPNDDIWNSPASSTTGTPPSTSSSTAAPAATPTAPAVTPAANPARNGAYVGLGDSVAAGLGLPTWTTATPQDKQCGRSPESFVFEVGRQLKKPHAPYACSGASSGDLFTRQWISNSNPEVQLDQTFAQGVPDVISITVGANDIGWGTLIQRCYTSACGTEAQTTAVNTALVAYQRNISKSLDIIKERSGNNPPLVILTGYYNPVSERCSVLYGDNVTPAEIAWITGGVNALNTTMQNVAKSYGSFTRYAAVDFTGHDLCSGNSNRWVQTASDPAPFHPTAAGQQAIARAVVATVNRAP